VKLADYLSARRRWWRRPVERIKRVIRADVTDLALGDAGVPTGDARLALRRVDYALDELAVRIPALFGVGAPSERQAHREGC
jgi:hypothetical protein